MLREATSGWRVCMGLQARLTQQGQRVRPCVLLSRKSQHTVDKYSQSSASQPAGEATKQLTDPSQADYMLRLGNDLVCIRQVGLLQYGTERHRRERRAHASDGRIEMIECLFLYLRCDFAS